MLKLKTPLESLAILYFTVDGGFSKIAAVKPELTTTSEQRPPAYSDCHIGVSF
jgi:hypothetical protein